MFGPSILYFKYLDRQQYLKGLCPLCKNDGVILQITLLEIGHGQTVRRQCKSCENIYDYIDYFRAYSPYNFD